MPSIIPGYEYDIFISYRQKDNKRDGWVTEFIDTLKDEIEATFKEDISIYFDENPHDGLHEHHEVDDSLKEKLKCLIFIPIVSQTYCDPKAFAWQNEFKVFIEQASQDEFGLKTKLSGGNVASRVLPVKIHDLDNEDQRLFESEVGGVMRSIDFIYKDTGVNRPLSPEDSKDENINKTRYKDQVNKVANAIKEIIIGIEGGDSAKDEKEVSKTKTKLISKESKPTSKSKVFFAAQNKKSDTEKGKRSIKNFLTSNQKVLVLTLVIIFLIVFLIYQGYFKPSSNPKVQPAHLQIALPADTYLAVNTDYPTLAISPDGSILAFVGVKEGKRYLYLKRLDEPGFELIQGTEDAVNPFFSTDGSSVGFFKGYTIMKVSNMGGLPIAMHITTPFGVSRGASWLRNDSILWTPSPNGGLAIGAANAEAVRPFTDWKVLSTKPYLWPCEIGEINSVLLTEMKSGKSEDADIVLLSLENGKLKQVVNGGTFPRYSSSGYILFARQGSLFSIPINIEEKEITGVEKELFNGLLGNANGSAQFAVGGTTLAYIAGEVNRESDQLVWVDREGNIEMLFSNGQTFTHPRLSHDGLNLAVSSFDGPNIDVWLLELNRKTFTRLTSHPGEDFGPVWSPDGKHLAISSEIAEDDGEEGPGIALLSIDSLDFPKRLFRTTGDGYWEFPTSWSSDGKWLLYTSTKSGPVGDIEMISMDNNEEYVIVEQTPNSEGGGVFSPSGRWIAYVSDNTGRDEIYIKQFPGLGARKQVSINGGREPVWSDDGSELFYRENDKMMVVSVQFDSAIQLSIPKMLFEGSFRKNYQGGGIHNYDVSTDGKRFIMVRRMNQSKPTVINIVLNWPEVYKLHATR